MKIVRTFMNISPFGFGMFIVACIIQIATMVAYYAAGNPIWTTHLDNYMQTWYWVCEFVPGLIFTAALTVAWIDSKRTRA